MIRSILTFALIFVVFAHPALAREGKLRCEPIAVLELFTSQGCASCPPADKLLSELSKRDNLITLAYHVDYWDYIGWRDTFADAAFTKYQRDYAAAHKSERIYTPQLVINGTKDVVGSRKQQVQDALAQAKLNLPIDLTTKDSMLNVKIAGNAKFKDAVVWLVTYKSEASVDIKRGENSNRRLDYTQIVTSRQILGMWDAQSGSEIRLPLVDVLRNHSDGAAIIVQQDENGLPGAIIGAASFTG